MLRWMRRENNVAHARGELFVDMKDNNPDKPQRGDLFVETNTEIEKSPVGAACNMPMRKKHEMKYGQNRCFPARSHALRGNGK